MIKCKYEELNDKIVKFEKTIRRLDGTIHHLEWRINDL